MWNSMKSSLMTRKTHIDTPDLPDEIWWQIIEFLPTEEVQRLYSVNRPFLEAAFQQRYRFVDMNNPLDKGRFRDLERRLKDERLAKYVRVIHLRPTILGDFLKLDIHGRRKWKGFRVFFNVLQKMNPMQPKAVLQKMNFSRQGPSFTAICVQPGAQTQFDRKILSNLASLTQLEVECNHFEFSCSAGYIPLVGFLSAGWGSFGQNLQVLKLKMPLLVIHDIVSSYHTTLKLPALQKLSLEVCLPRPPLANDLPGDVTGLTTLINNHSNTLQALTLRSLYSEHSLDLSLRYLSHLPSLDSFSISIDKTTDCSALHDFLSSHSRQLKNLEIRLEQGSPYLKIPAGYWYQFPCFHVELPGLRSLSLDASRSVHYFETAAAVDYVLRYNAELATLRFTARCRSFADNDLFNGKFAVGSNLRKLHIFTNYLNPDLLRFLSTTLPDLQDLTVKYHFLLPQGMSEIYLRGELVAEEFCKEMNKVPVPEWAVHSLFTSATLGYNLHINMKCRTALATAFPNILTFNGLERKDYLTPGCIPDYPYYNA